MKRIERFKFLQIFGDGKPHNWFEIVFLGVQFLKVHQTVFEKLFKKALADGIIIGVETPLIQARRAKAAEHTSGIYYICSWHDYEYKITSLGEECLREEQIARDGDVSYYKYFDRTIGGENGLDKFAPLPKGVKQI